MFLVTGHAAIKMRAPFFFLTWRNYEQASTSASNSPLLFVFFLRFESKSYYHSATKNTWRRVLLRNPSPMR